MEEKTVGGIKIVTYYKEVQKNIGSFVFRMGVFPENNDRREVDYNKKKIKIRNIGYRNRLRKRKAKTTNADILYIEYLKGTNWLLDSVDPKVNPDANKVLKLLKGFPILQKQNFDFWVQNRRRCNGLVAIFRMFVERNIYNLHNSQRTIDRKGFDAYLRDSRQLQKSITSAIIYNDEVIGKSDKK